MKIEQDNVERFTNVYKVEFNYPPAQAKQMNTKRKTNLDKRLNMIDI